MSKEQGEKLAQDVIVTTLRDCGARLHFEGVIPPFDPKKPTINEDIWGIALELIENCVYNRIPGSEIGATEVKVTFGERKLTVEDNFVYDNPEEILARLVYIRDSGKPITTKPIDPDSGLLFGGAGIFGTIRRLKIYNGRLEYRIKSGTIVAEVTWSI